MVISNSVYFEKLINLISDLSQSLSLNSQINTIKKFIIQEFLSDFYYWNQSTADEKNIDDQKPDDDFIKLLNEIIVKKHDFIGFQNDYYWFCRPLLKNDYVYGAVIIRRQSSPFSFHETQSFLLISDYLSLANQIENLNQQNLINNKQLGLVRSVVGQLVDVTDLSALARKICHLIQKTFNYYYVAVFTIEPEKDELVFRASAGAPGSAKPKFEYSSTDKLVIGEHIVGYVAQSGKRLLANNVDEEPRYGYLESLPETKSEVALPLINNQKTVGVLDIQSDKVNSFDQDDILILEALSDNLAIAVQRVRLIQQINYQKDQLSLINKVSQAITAIFNLDDLLEKVVQLIHNQFGYPFVHIFLLNPQNNSVDFKAGSGSRAKNYAKGNICYSLDSEKGMIPWVAKNGRVMRVGDVTKSRKFLPNPITQDQTGSEITLPLIFGKEILGVLDIQTNLNNAFSAQDEANLKTLSANVATAIRNANLYRSEQWRRQVAESLRNVALLLTAHKKIDEILKIILDELGKILPCHFSAFWLLENELNDDNHQQSIQLNLAAYNSQVKHLELLFANGISIEGSWLADSLSMEEPLIRDDLNLRDPIADQIGLKGNYSAISAPLIASGRFLGLLTLHHDSKGRYGIETKKITSSFAGYSAIAIENSLLYKSSQEQAWVSTVLLQVAQATQSLTTIPELVSTVVRLTPLLVGVEGCGIYLREHETGNYYLHAIYGEAFSIDDIDNPILIDNNQWFENLNTNHLPVISSNAINDLNLPLEITNNLDQKTLILLPLITRNELLGAFLLVQNSPLLQTNENYFDDKERLAIIQGITQQTAIAVENIRLLEEKQEEAYISAVLLQIAQAVVSFSNLQDTLESIIHTIPILVGIDCCIIYLYDELQDQFTVNHIHCSTSSESSLEIKETSYITSEFPLLEAIKITNKAFLHPIERILPPEDWDLIIPDETIRDFTQILGSPYNLIMGFPLSVKGELFGVMLTQETSSVRNRKRRFELLQGIAQQATLAIQNDQLNRERIDREKLEREFQLARDIQKTFLPEFLPQVDGYEFDVRWHTARQVGGDFYDIFKINEEQYGLVIADVSDKGLAASLYMTVARTLLRAVALESVSTSKTLERVNDLLLLDSQKGFFVTTFYAIINPKSGQIRYSNAGHNQPFVISEKTKKLETLKSSGIALGAMSKIKLSEYEMTLSPGNSLILYTDGVTEATNNLGQFYGTNRFLSVIKENIGNDINSIIDKVESDLSDFRNGAPYSDDTTILAIRRIPLLAN